KGNTLLRLQRQEEAWPIFEKYLPRYYSFEQNFSLTKYSGSRFTQQCEEALSLYEEAIHFDPTDICAYLGKCHILLELGRHEEAQATREQVERIEEKVQLASPQL